MDIELHQKICETIRNYEGLSKDCLKYLTEVFPSISYDTLYSILSNEYQMKMRYNYRKIQNDGEKYYALYQEKLKNNESKILIQLSILHGIPPCLLAKVVLQQFFDEQEIDDAEKKESTTNINNYLKNTNLISDANLAYEVFLCTIFDNLNSPSVDLMRTSLGQQYEIRLHKEATAIGLGFRNEEYLRNNGYDKTPDLKLEVPAIIDGFIINWIESKALFADKDVHRIYEKNQYLSYWNRFGPGLVIYWFGYLKTIIEPNDKRFIIRDHLPKNIQKWNV